MYHLPIIAPWLINNAFRCPPRRRRRRRLSGCRRSCRRPRPWRWPTPPRTWGPQGFQWVSHGWLMLVGGLDGKSHEHGWFMMVYKKGKSGGTPKIWLGYTPIKGLPILEGRVKITVVPHTLHIEEFFNLIISPPTIFPCLLGDVPWLSHDFADFPATLCQSPAAWCSQRGPHPARARPPRCHPESLRSWSGAEHGRTMVRSDDQTGASWWFNHDSCRH